MAYNALFYGVNNSFCNQTNNNLQKKNNALRQITAHVQPHVLGLNEISSNANIQNMVLDSILNINGVNKFKKAQITNYSSSSIVNALFYDSEKLTLYNEYALVTGARDINFYYFYHNSPNLAETNDTTFMVFILAHLTAGSSSSNANSRNVEANMVINHLASINKSNNYFFMGDFNLYSSSEAAFQTITTNSNQNARFFDPINQIGAWSNNAAFASVHTQSTHTSTNCFVGGGMDDRFDFIMVSSPVLNDFLKVKYIPNSYVTLGQDGLRLDNSLIDTPTNTSAPANVIQALYDMSDHLPIFLDVRVNYSSTNVNNFDYGSYKWIKTQNPFSETLQMSVFTPKNNKFNFSLFEITGRKVHEQTNYLHEGENLLDINLNFLQKGIYILNVSDNVNKSANIKLIKN